MKGADVFEQIRADHQAVLDLFERIESTVDDERTRLIERCIQELLLHAIAEEETLYRRLRTNEDLREDVLEAEVEHSLIERLANEIMSSSPTDELCDARLMVLKELVEGHFDEEEAVLLPAAQTLIDEAAAEALGTELRARKAALQVEGLELVEQLDVYSDDSLP